jgi:hypothetical protein
MNKINSKASDSRSLKSTKKALCSFGDSNPSTDLDFAAARRWRYRSIPKSPWRKLIKRPVTLSRRNELLLALNNSADL